MNPVDTSFLRLVSLRRRLVASCHGRGLSLEGRVTRDRRVTTSIQPRLTRHRREDATGKQQKWGVPELQ
jgi:hypothetical protein